MFMKSGKTAEIEPRFLRRCAGEKPFERELAPFAKIRDGYPRMLIARTRNPETDFEGVRIVHLADWLSGVGGNLQ